MSRTLSRPFFALLSARTPRHARKPSGQRRNRRLWALEALEDRVLLAATVYTVNAITDTGAGSGTTGDLLYCLTQANANPNTAGSQIQFDPTVFGTPQTITLSSTLKLSETAGPEVIDGPGASVVTVSGNNAVEVFSVSHGVTAGLVGLTISGGAIVGSGGGILNYGTLTVSDSTITGNSAADAFSGAAGDGGGIFNSGILTVSDSTITGNSAAESFGAAGSGDGGGIFSGFNSFGTLTVTNSTITDNSADDSGGGISSFGTATVSDSTITDNAAEFGGGIYSNTRGRSYAILTVSDSTITDNSADNSGGGIANDGTATVSDSTISQNSSLGGGGIWNTATLTVTNSTIADNAAGSGGGIANHGGATVSDSTITDNAADDSGGGIYSNGFILTVTNSTIADNAAGSGGGIYTEGQLTAVNDTIAYNTVPSGGFGGGLDASAGTATLNNAIVALNTSATGSGTTPDDIYLGGGVVSSSSAYNLIGTGGSGGLTNGVNGNQVGVANPGLGTLSDNGGPTQTIALLPGSPAIDAGSNALAVDPSTGKPLTTDQRGTGFVRIINGTVDIGAYEVQTSLVVTTQPPANVTAGSAFGLIVTVEDNSFGHVDTSFSGTVTVTLLTNPGGATLGGTLSVTFQRGVATFSGLTLDKTGTRYTLLVSSSGLPPTTTSAFNVTPATASQLVIRAVPRQCRRRAPSSRWSSRPRTNSATSPPRSAAAWRSRC